MSKLTRRTCAPFGADRQLADALLARYGHAIGRSFVPPWRSDSTSTAAEIYRDEVRGLYICQDFGGVPRAGLKPGDANPESMILPEWYAAFETGEARVLSSKDCTNWTKRALVETGRLPFTVEAPSPDSLAQVRPFDMRVYVAFRMRYDVLRGKEPAIAFTSRWAATWLGVPRSKMKVHASIQRLRELGLMHKVDEMPGVGRPMFLYVPGDGTPDPALTKDGADD